MANFTRKEIKKTFIALLEEHRYSDITIKDLVETCGISRSAFYYHYHDIPELLEEIIKERADEVIGQYTKIESAVECIDAMGAAIKDNKRALMHIYRSVDREYLEKQLIRLCNYVVSNYIHTTLENEPLTEKEMESIISYHEYLMLGFIISWFESGMQDEMAVSFRDTIGQINNFAQDMARKLKEEQIITE